ncbi:response regulator [Terriglobus sp.]|uniref:response regulator n=1 Tax=Terriglobus sp. TaxID=1889013 RepID=UPI003B005BFE
MSVERLLLVEDDETTREVLVLLLEADGWSVRAAGSGEAATDALAAGEVRPVVILCDLHLPGIHGGALAEALRSMAPEAALLAMSASESSDGAAGYQALLRKPFGPPEVRAALAALAAAASNTGAEPGVRSGRDSSAQNEDEGGLPVVATETFLKLEQQMGLRAKDLYAFALADAEDRLRRMGSLPPEGIAAFQAEAHQLKGSAGMIGAQRLARLAAQAELMDAMSSYGLRTEKVRRMHLACDEIRLMLKTLFPI